jgi:predicted DNA-binding transcriptional regulator YafY
MTTKTPTEAEVEALRVAAASAYANPGATPTAAREARDAIAAYFAASDALFVHYWNSVSPSTKD